MHGRPRKPAKAEDAAASAAKAEKLRLLQSQLLHNHHHRIYTKEALDLSSRLIEFNPEVYTAWNYRKLATRSLLDGATDLSDLNSIVDGELRVVEIALRRNPKCYAAWYHRKWVLGKKLREVDFEHEFRLLDQLLKADSRNFHGWNYWRFVAVFKGVSEEEQLNFMTDKINSNFSNYSAWHNRSVLLSQLLLKKPQDIFPREKVLSEEFELVHQALFTDPDDQSGWFYYLWLLNQTTAIFNPLLICSWPPDGSILISLTNGKSDEQACSTRYQLDSFLERGYLPIVLYFNQAVKGVNSSTVNVQSSFVKNEELVWRPLSTTKSTEANFWMTYLKLAKLKVDASNAYSIEVSLGSSHGIISSSGSPYVVPYQFGFTLDVSYNHLEQAKVEKENLVTWDSGELHTIGSLPVDIDVAFVGELKISEDNGHGYSKWLVEMLSKEIDLFHDLLECKIGKLTLARLLRVHTFVSKQRSHIKEILELYDDLMKLDPSHVRYYRDEKSVVLMDQVTFDKSFLAKRCWQRKRSGSLRSHDHTVLRLDNLSLSRIGFTERLLWVRALDLSHNELRSIQGLEALQLLSYLNLGNNRISSFSALEPLKLMHSLEVLDVSYNEIGAHPIDTTRYLCASPLSHSTTDDLNGDKNKEDVEASENWEAVLLFRDLHLTQLHIVGNVAAIDGLKGLLVKVLPTLEWLDGCHL